MGVEMHAQAFWRVGILMILTLGGHVGASATEVGADVIWSQTERLRLTGS